MTEPRDRTRRQDEGLYDLDVSIARMLDSWLAAGGRKPGGVTGPA